MSDTKRTVPHWVKKYVLDWDYNTPREKKLYAKGADGKVQSLHCGSSHNGKLDTYDDRGGSKKKSRNAIRQQRRQLNRNIDDSE